MSNHYTSDGEPRPNYGADEDIDTSACAETSTVDDIFSDDFELEEVSAKRYRMTRKTAARYRNKPNGLPFLSWGGRIRFLKKRAPNSFGRS